MTKKELKTELDKRGLLFSAGPREIFVKGFGVLMTPCRCYFWARITRRRRRA